MIAQLSGRLTAKSPERAVVDVHGVGYACTIPLTTYYHLPAVGEPVTLLVYTHVREDTIALYGFGTAEERDLFELLIGVSKIGPRLARNILSGLPAEELRAALAKGDAARLARIPGVGPKTAERMLVELKDKAALSEPVAVQDDGQPPEGDPVAGDCLSALTNLGYRKGEATRAVEAAQAALGPKAPFEALLKQALRALVP
ncbi:MAG: Holliday junction branch migration protein RuvA [Candidatus Tectimicrobiota bacterium]